MARAFFITHPEVAIDANVPVPKWHLTDRGVARMRAFAHQPEVANLTAVWSSEETKAIEGAGILAARFGLPVHVDAGLGENDRSSTGFVPPDVFEQYANGFFGAPEQSFKGWERAVDAQARVIGAVERILLDHPGGDIAFVAHGGVGTLLLCRYLNEAINRKHDQPFSGHYFTFDTATRRVLHGWKNIALA